MRPDHEGGTPPSRLEHLQRFAAAALVTVVIANLGALTPRPVLRVAQVSGQELPDQRTLDPQSDPDEGGSGAARMRASEAARTPTASADRQPDSPGLAASTSNEPAPDPSWPAGSGRIGRGKVRAPVATREDAPAPPAAARAVTTGDPAQAVLVRGRVLDAERKAPLRGAHVLAGSVEAYTDDEGRFSLGPVPRGTLALVKSPGYEKRRIPLEAAEATIRLRPHTVKAAYLTYYGIGERAIRDRVLGLVDRTELNGVVIDVKGDRGLIPYRTAVPAALAAGAQGPVIIKDFDGLLARLKERGVYTIARIVVFKDSVLAHHRPELAVIDTRTGRPWVDREKLAWVDPFREEVWDYVIAIAKEAALKGFDEIQFDYIRFPTDGRLSAARYARPATKETRLPTIAAFLARARRELAPTGAFIAADVFGYTAFNDNDTDIGQRIEELAPHLDFICPMVYPSGYHRGIPGYVNPVKHPYEVVRESVRLIRQRAGMSPARVRPWLQDFRDYAFGRKVFGIAEVQAQIRGSADAGGVGWMLWNPRNEYTGAALRLEGDVAAAPGAPGPVSD
jgi:hypothetical protein